MRLRQSLPLLLLTSLLALAGCAYEPSYSYQTVPCQPSADASVPPPPNAPAPQSGTATTLPANSPSAPAVQAATSIQPSPQLCMVPAPYDASATAYNYAWKYGPYWNYGWPYYGYGIGFVGGGFHHFHHAFHGDHFHGAGFHGAHHGGSSFHGGGHGGRH